MSTPNWECILLNKAVGVKMGHFAAGNISRKGAEPSRKAAKVFLASLRLNFAPLSEKISA